jgi:hypothetical protein
MILLLLHYSDAHIHSCVAVELSLCLHTLQVIVSRELIEQMIEHWVGSEQLLQAGSRMAQQQQQQQQQQLDTGVAAELMADCFSPEVRDCLLLS